MGQMTASKHLEISGWSFSQSLAVHVQSVANPLLQPPPLLLPARLVLWVHTIYQACCLSMMSQSIWLPVGGLACQGGIHVQTFCMQKGFVHDIRTHTHVVDKFKSCWLRLKCLHYHMQCSNCICARHQALVTTGCSVQHASWSLPLCAAASPQELQAAGTQGLCSQRHHVQRQAHDPWAAMVGRCCRGGRSGGHDDHKWRGDRHCSEGTFCHGYL